MSVKISMYYIRMIYSNRFFKLETNSETFSTSEGLIRSNRIPYTQSVKIGIFNTFKNIYDIQNIPIGELFKEYYVKVPIIKNGLGREELIVSESKLYAWTCNGWEVLRRIVIFP